jgi:hypothetical protein
MTGREMSTVAAALVGAQPARAQRRPVSLDIRVPVAPRQESVSVAMRGLSLRAVKRCSSSWFRCPRRPRSLGWIIMS